MLNEVTEDRERTPNFLVVDLTIKGLVQSVDKFRHAANLLPKFFRMV
jgi:hypothetical protein